LGGHFIVPLPDQPETGQQRNHDNGAANNAIRQRLTQLLHHQIAKQEDPAEQKPEQRRGIAFRVSAVAKGHHNQQHHDEADQVIHAVNGDEGHHGAISCVPCSAFQAITSRRMLASRRSRRVIWMISAAIAVGMAHRPICSGSIPSIPFSFRNASISSTAPKAIKISSPKKTAILSHAAAWALILSRIVCGSSPYSFRAAPSAIGASSGRTVCAWPPRDIRPSAAVPSRATK